jgi:hypothetical protein
MVSIITAAMPRAIRDTQASRAEDGAATRRAGGSGLPPDFLISIYAVIASEAKQSMDTAGEEWIASSLRSSQ